jgi:RHS repeat-associated protein
MALAHTSVSASSRYAAIRCRRWLSKAPGAPPAMRIAAPKKRAAAARCPPRIDTPARLSSLSSAVSWPPCSSISVCIAPRASLANSWSLLAASLARKRTVSNRLTSMALSDGNNVAYTYDAVRNRLTMTDWRGLSNYTYDVLSRVLSVGMPDGKTVAYAYDALGDRVKLTYPDGKSVQYQYDALNRLNKVTDWANKSTSYVFDPASNLTVTAQPNGTSSLYAYDPANRLVGITNLSGFLPLSAFGYSLDKVGNRTSVLSSAGGVDQYGYDGLYRLTSWTDFVGHVTRYSYDAVGNRVSLVAPAATTNYTYDAADQLLKAGTTTFSYDGNGSQTTKTTGTATVNYGWDALNRLISVTGGSINTQYQYDGDGNRIHQQVGANAYQYVNDTVTALPVVLNENGPDGNIDYAFGQSLISATSPTFESFYQFDGLGSITSVTNPTGSLAANYAYDPWGQPITPILPPFALDTLGTKNKYKFTGAAVDPSDQLLFLRARYYDASIGRFVNRDPLPGVQAYPLSMNKYEYALANPLRFSDPSGLSADEFAPTTPDSTPESLLTEDNLSQPSVLSSIGSACGKPDLVGGAISLFTSLPGVDFGYGLYEDLKDPAIRNNVPLLIGRQSIDLLVEVVSDASVVGTVGKVALSAYNLVSAACPKATDQAVNQLLGAH